MIAGLSRQPARNFVVLGVASTNVPLAGLADSNALHASWIDTPRMATVCRPSHAGEMDSVLFYEHLRNEVLLVLTRRETSEATIVTEVACRRGSYFRRRALRDLAGDGQGTFQIIVQLPLGNSGLISRRADYCSRRARAVIGN